jgi:CheY-like chemotaxis protein
MRVLYVDDDRINTLLFEETCRFAGGLELRCAATGAEALELAAEFLPQLLVVDLHLPDTDGYVLLPALRSALGSADTPAFLCSADEPAVIAQRAAAAGFQGCWAKPIDLKAVLADLARLGAAR